MDKSSASPSADIEKFIANWSDREGGQERANYSLFLVELCDVLGVAHPEPACASHELNDYVFERRVERVLPDGTPESGRIDLYKRDHFILEAKQSRKRQTKRGNGAKQGDLFPAAASKNAPIPSGTMDHLMIQARQQAEGYLSSLPRDHASPPFIIVCDVGRVFELYADFSGHGRHYSQFPDSHGFRIELQQLSDPEVRALLKTVWEAPHSLDPAKQTAKVTREIAGQLAEISKALEARGFDSGVVAVFLMRCLFTMFVEDVGLLRKKGFTELLTKCINDPSRFTDEIDDLWRHMDRGGYSPGIGERLLRFNGKLFKNAEALPLLPAEIELLRDASNADWRDLEPAIFGSLFEQALHPEERKKLGAHYTPRAYVQLVVDATIIEPLAQDWAEAQSAAERAFREGMISQAISEIREYLTHLSSVRVLDPACGTGNFLYVALRRMKQLEGEALKLLHDIGGDEAVTKANDISVKPDQFFGMEINKRAVEIAELVLWIGYIQWHLRTRSTPPPEPVLGSADHVHKKDALLTWTGYPNPQLKLDALGRLAGDPTNFAYPDAMAPDWPPADFIVGNPPFIGGKDIRSRLGAGYADALRKAHRQVNASADFVMYWWDRAAQILTAPGTRLRRFGFVTTNSITQVFQRKILERYLTGTTPISLRMAIPDHPWTKASKDAAAVRIAITVAIPGEHDGTLRVVVNEDKLDTDEPKIDFEIKQGRINPDLTIGVDITKVNALQANDALCSRGMSLHGEGFIVSRTKALELGLGIRHGLENFIKNYRNGRDLTAFPRNVLVIDLFELDKKSIRERFPEVYQHLQITVKQERDKNNRASYRDKWWCFGEPRKELRPALKDLQRYIVTVETTKHRVFQFLPSDILPDNKLIAIASDDAYHLGVLSSSIHSIWALEAGGTLEDRPSYTKSRCFDPFPFPEASAAARRKISDLAEELDQTRKAVLAENPDLTLTTLYNAMELARSGVLLTAKDQDVQSRGRTLILQELHDQIDDAVMRAYGWASSTTDEEILAHLVELNLARSSEERRGFIRWLRPDFQIEKFGPLSHKADRVQSISAVGASKVQPAFPVEWKAQAGQVLDLLSRSRSPLSADQIAANFENQKRAAGDVRDVLTSLNRLGQVESFDGGRSYVRTAS